MPLPGLTSANLDEPVALGEPASKILGARTSSSSSSQ